MATQKTARKMPRLGHGVREYSTHEPPSKEHARNVFLQEVHRLAPKVLNDLAGKPFELYRQTGFAFQNGTVQDNDPRVVGAWYNWITYQRSCWSDVELWHEEAKDGSRHVKYDDSVAAFCERLFRWSHHHNLDAEWCRKRAFDTLDWWCVAPDSPEGLDWYMDRAWLSVLGRGARFEFGCDVLFPVLGGSRKEVEERFLARAKEEFGKFLDQLDQQAEQNGLIRVPQKRQLKHFVWLVEHQVNNLTYPQIAEKYPDETGSDVGRITDGVISTASLIVLPLRGAPGRRNR